MAAAPPQLRTLQPSRRKQPAAATRAQATAASRSSLPRAADGRRTPAGLHLDVAASLVLRAFPWPQTRDAAGDHADATDAPADADEDTPTEVPRRERPSLRRAQLLLLSCC